MRRKKTYAIDIDGVIADIEPSISRRIANEFNLGVEEGFVKRKDKFFMHERYDIDPETMDRFVRGPGVFGDPLFWDEALPIWENIDAIHKIGLLDRVIFITGRHEDARDATDRWLHSFVGDIGERYETLMCNTKDRKHKAMSMCGAEILIEDRPYEALIAAKKGFRSYVIRREYNLKDEFDEDIAHDNITWVNNIWDVMEVEKNVL